MIESSKFLQEVRAAKLAEIEAGREWRGVHELREAVKHAFPPRGFRAALQEGIDQDGNAVIAELSRAAPGRRKLRDAFEPMELAADLTAAGAACLSVATDRDFFDGDTRFLERARDACPLPVMRRDFIIDTWQIYESRLIGADAILLTVALLTDGQLIDCAECALDLDLDVVVEVSSAEQLVRADLLPINLLLINVNNDIEASLALARDGSEDCIAIIGCDLKKKRDVNRCNDDGVQAFLQRDSLMRAKDPARKLRELFPR